MRKPIDLALAIVGIAVACGGHVSGQDAPQCPYDIAGSPCSGNDVCKPASCAADGVCSCVNARWECPSACTPPAPPNPGDCELLDPSNGLACSVEGMSCPTFGNPKCGDVSYPCTCTSGKWSCPEPKCPPCPDSFTIHTGGSCGGQGPLSCPGRDSCGNTTSCFCSGPTWTWSCNSGCVDGGGPPDAKPD